MSPKLGVSFFSLFPCAGQSDLYLQTGGAGSYRLFVHHWWLDKCTASSLPGSRVLGAGLVDYRNAGSFPRFWGNRGLDYPIPSGGRTIRTRTRFFPTPDIFPIIVTGLVVLLVAFPGGSSRQPLPCVVLRWLLLGCSNGCYACCSFKPPPAVELSLNSPAPSRHLQTFNFAVVRKQLRMRSSGKAI